MGTIVVGSRHAIVRTGRGSVAVRGRGRECGVREGALAVGTERNSASRVVRRDRVVGAGAMVWSVISDTPSQEFKPTHPDTA
jgi:hypothetical protein